MTRSSVEVGRARRAGGLRRYAVSALGAIAVLAACTSGEPEPHWQHVTWENYGGGPDQSKFVALDQITKENVHQLEVAWFYPTGDELTYTFNPIVVDTVVYVLAKNSSLVALHAETGRELWIHAHLTGIPRRGLNYWESEDGTDKRILFQINNYLQTIDAETGQSILTFGNNGLVDLKEGLPPRDPSTISRAQSSTPGIVFENLIVLGMAPGEGYMDAPGHIRAYDARTGEMVWRFNTIPQPGEFGYDTWPPEAYRYAAGANVWGEMSLDVERGILFAGTASPSYDFYGADRKGANLFGNTLLALDARTGERIWHFQVVHHDLRDYDLVAAPQLITVNHDGRRIDAVAIATKQGLMYAFNRETGEPLWPVVEVPIPQGHVPGEEYWPTAPVMPDLPPYARQSMTSDDLSPFLTDEEREYWTAWVDSAVARNQMGLFTPLSDRYGTLAIPGAGGATNFGHTASDPQRGIVYLISNDRPGPYDPMMPRYAPSTPQADSVARAAAGAGEAGGGSGGGFGGGQAGQAEMIASGGTLYSQNCQVCHGANRMGIGGAPSLQGLETRMGGSEFLMLMRSGRGKMPAFNQFSDDEVTALYRYLGGTADGERVDLPAGPVVAVGGAPGGLLPRPVTGAGGFGGFGRPYPEEATDAPDVRYFIRSYAEEYAHIIKPPWSSLVAYDLNTGTIKWSVPLGTDKLAAEMGDEKTGVQETIRNGLLVTSTGLVFSNAKDGRVYAFDAETGEELWSHEIPGGIGSQGIPTMYRVNGRQFLVLSASTPLVWMRRTPEPGNPTRGYVAFALPESAVQ